MHALHIHHIYQNQNTIKPSTFFRSFTSAPHKTRYMALSSPLNLIFIIIMLAITSTSAGSSPVKTLNVEAFGAKGDGSDATQAFLKAWKQACSTKGSVVLLVPQGKTYLLKPVRFSGPCASTTLTVQISGTLEASKMRSDYSKDLTHWILFDNVNNLLVNGGTINGNGKVWWQNSCKVNKKLPCKSAPTAMTFYKCNNLMLKNLKSQDSQQIHLSFESCKNVQVSGLRVTAPEESPNTDGIHITNTQNIRVSNSIIATGDDCFSIESGSQNVQALNITCGPGHGISIGSLGDGKGTEIVSGVTVDGAKFIGTTNGVRIKTWQGGSGSASNIKFQNIEMDNVDNPIIIDQNYCDQNQPCKQQKSAIQVKNVLYKNIKGTSASEVAVRIECSKAYPCQGIVLQNVNLKLQGNKQAQAICTSAKLTQAGAVPSCTAA